MPLWLWDFYQEPVRPGLTAMLWSGSVFSAAASCSPSRVAGSVLLTGGLQVSSETSVMAIVQALPACASLFAQRLHKGWVVTRSQCPQFRQGDFDAGAKVFLEPELSERQVKVLVEVELRRRAEAAHRKAVIGWVEGKLARVEFVRSLAGAVADPDLMVMIKDTNYECRPGLGTTLAVLVGEPAPNEVAGGWKGVEAFCVLFFLRCLHLLKKPSCHALLWHIRTEFADAGHLSVG